MPGDRLREHSDEQTADSRQQTKKEDIVQISEYAFYRLYLADEERLTRELERRRVALERLEDDRATGVAVETGFQRVANRLRLSGHLRLHSPR